MLPSAKMDLVNILEYITRESGNLIIGRRFVSALRLQCRDLLHGLVLSAALAPNSIPTSAALPSRAT